MIAGRMERLSIKQAFAARRAKRQIALMPFIPAGFPSLEITAAVLPALAAGGADLIEIGIPFSDPIADGPVIQAAFTETLHKKIKVADIFATVASVRSQVAVPLLAMLSYSIVFRHGVKQFVTDAKSAGFDGLIIPDLPPPEAQTIVEIIRSGGLETVLLIAPTTEAARRAEIARLSSGFIYYMSVAGITGERKSLPDDLAKNLAELKTLTATPVCVGFGVSNAGHVRQLIGVADGAIVGTALVRQMTAARDQTPAEIADVCKAYCRELLSGAR